MLAERRVNKTAYATTERIMGIDVLRAVKVQPGTLAECLEDASINEREGDDNDKRSENLAAFTPASFSDFTQRRLLLFCPFSPVLRARTT